MENSIYESIKMEIINRQKKEIIQILEQLPDNIRAFIINLVSNYNTCRKDSSIIQNNNSSTTIDIYLHTIEMLCYFNIIRYKSDFIISVITKNYLTANVELTTLKNQEYGTI